MIIPDRIRLTIGLTPAIILCPAEPGLYSLDMTMTAMSGAALARTHSGRFRVVPYAELREKATAVAQLILERHAGVARGVVVAPILGGGGLPARLIVDALMPFGLVEAVVPCQIRRYTGVENGGEAEVLLELDARRVEGRVVIGVDDLVDGGQTLVKFCEHVRVQGAERAETAVIYAKPQSIVKPDYLAEDGVKQWLVLPGEEHAFMHELVRTEKAVGLLGAEERLGYFEALGLDGKMVRDQLKL